MKLKKDISKIYDDCKAKGLPIIRTNSCEYLCKQITDLEPKRVLEFGTAEGYSAIMMLNSCDANLVTVELNENRANNAKANLQLCGFQDRAEVIVGDALEIAKQLQEKGETFDFIFLDSAKAQYIKLLPMILSLLNDKGMLIADDVLFRGYIYGDFPKRYKTIVKRLNEFINACKNEKLFKTVEILDIEDGLLIAKKR